MLRQTGKERNAQTGRGGADILLNGKYTGCSTRGQTLVRHARSSSHLLQRPEPSWAFHTAVIDEAKGRGCTAVLVIDDDTGRSYHAQLSTLAAYGQPFNYGRGDQIRLPLRHWRQEPAVDPAPAAVAATPAQPQPQRQPEPMPQAQMTLFGEVTR